MSVTFGENDFDFYLRFAKPLVLNLSDPDDRARAAAWVQKLRNEDVGSLSLRTNYLKLLLFVLQRNRLIGTFTQNPSTFEKLDEFPDDLKDTAKELLEAEEIFRQKQRGEGGDYPTYTTEHSADLLEYAAAQEIPNFGVHAYYAISNDPLPLWNHTEHAVFPRGTLTAAGQLDTRPPPETGDTSLETTMSQKRVQFNFDSKSKMKVPSRYTPFQSQPMQAGSPKPSTSREGRSPLTWGSNLIGVTDPVTHEYEPLPIADEDIGILEMSPPQLDFSDSLGPQASFEGDADAAEGMEAFDAMLDEFERDEPHAGPSVPLIPRAKSCKRRSPKGERKRKVKLYPVQAEQQSAYSSLTAEQEAEVLEDIAVMLQSPQRPQPFEDTPPRQLYSSLSPYSPPRVDMFKNVRQFELLSPPTEDMRDPYAHVQPFSQRHEYQYSPSEQENYAILQDLSLPFKTPSPRRPQRNIFSPTFVDDEQEISILSDAYPSFLDDSALSLASTSEDPSLPLRTPSPRRRQVDDVSVPLNEPDLLETLGLSSDQTQVAPEGGQADTTASKAHAPLVISTSPAAQDIIDDFNRQIISQSQQLSARVQEKPKKTIPKGIPRRVPSRPGAAQIPHAQRQKQGPSRPKQPQQNVGKIPRPGRSLIARPSVKRKLEFDGTDELELQRLPPSPQRIPPVGKIPKPGRSFIAQPSVKRKLQFDGTDEIELQRSSLQRLPPSPPRLSPQRIPSPQRHTSPHRSPSQQTIVTRTIVQSPRRSPERRSPTRVKEDGDFDYPFKIDDSDSMLQFQFETPPAEYDIPEPPLSPYDRFGLPRPIIVAELPPIVHSPYTSPERPVASPLRPTRSFQRISPERQTELSRPALVRSPQAGTSTEITKTFIHTPHPFSLRKPVLIELDDSFGKQDLPELSEKVYELHEESFEYLDSPEALSPKKKFEYLPSEEIQAEILSIISQTSPDSPIKEDYLFQEVHDASFSPVSSETPPGIDFPSPEILPTSISEVFLRTPPQAEFEFPEYMGSSPVRADSPPRTYLVPVATISEQQIPRSPDSPIESPRSLRNRLRRTPYSYYGARQRLVVAPRTQTIRELPDNYRQEDMAFLQNVQTASGRFRKRRRKYDMSKPPLDNVFESPIKISTQYDVKDPLFTQSYFKELAERAPDLMEEDEKLVQSPRVNREKEMLEIWSTPPHLKTTPIRIPLPVDIGSPLSPSRSPQPIDEEDILPNEPASPVMLSPEELQIIRICRDISNTLDFAQFEDEDVINITPPLITTEQLPSDIMHSPSFSPELRTPSPVKLPRLRPVTPHSPLPGPSTSGLNIPYSPPESPTSLHTRIWVAEEPRFPRDSAVRMMSGKTKSKKLLIKRGLKAPREYTIQEETEVEGYGDEHVPFRYQVESSRPTFTKRRKRVKMPRVTLDDIRESPIRIPLQYELDDRTGIRLERERLERKFANLPQLEYEYPEELFGTASSNLPQTKPFVSLLDVTPPSHSAPILVPSGDVPGWKSPPEYKKTPHKRSEFTNVMDRVRLYDASLQSERIPASVLYSPPTMSPAEMERLRKLTTRPLTPPRQRTPPRQQTPPRQRTPPRQQTPPRQPTPPRQYSPPRLIDQEIPAFESPEFLERELLVEEALPDDMLNVSASPRTPRRPPPEPLSPLSSPESPISLLTRLYQQPDPPYASRSYMDVVVGSGKQVRVRKRAARPRVQSIKELPEDVPEEQIPFYHKVESAGRMLPFPRQRVQRRPRLRALREEPMHVPNWFEVEPVHLRSLVQELEKKHGKVEEELKITPRAKVELEWTTPPHLRKRTADSDLPFNVPEDAENLYYEGQPIQLLLSPPALSPGSRPATTYWESPRQGIDFEQLGSQAAVVTGMDLETLPEDFVDSEPIISPSGKTIIQKLSPRAAASPRLDLEILPEEPIEKESVSSIILRRRDAVSIAYENSPHPITFEQLAKKAEKSPVMLDLAILDEEDLQESPRTPTSPRRIAPYPSRNRRRPLSSATKFLTKLVTRDAYKELMESEEGTLPPSPPSVRPTVEEQLDRSLEEFEAMERMFEIKEAQSQPQAKKTPGFYERIEELIYDVPDPHTPRPPPLYIPRLGEMISPPMSPKLPRVPRQFVAIDEDDIPNYILEYGSPKTPPKVSSPKKVTPKQLTPKKRFPATRNLFDDFDETDVLLEQEELEDEPLLASPVSPGRPPTPPNLDEFYTIIESPKRPESPDIGEELRQHRYTPHRYDTRRQMLTKHVQIKNKRVPIRKSRKPRYTTIAESIDEDTNVPPRSVIIREKIVPSRPKSPILPPLQPFTLEFDSPPKPEKVVIPPQYVYTNPIYTEGIYSVSPPRNLGEIEEVIEFPEFPSPEQLPTEFVWDPEGDYSLPRATYFGSPGRQYVRTPSHSRPTDRNQYVRSPGRRYNSPRVVESVTVTEFGEPYEEFDLRYNPYVLDTTPIEMLEEEDGAVGYQ